MRRIGACGLLAAAAVTGSAETLEGGHEARSEEPPGFKLVARGLDNPRGLAADRRGTIYVTEAGRGGPSPCATMGGVNMCYGPTGAIARVRKNHVTRIATHLPSYAPTGGGGATGPTRICFDRTGRMFVTYGLRADPSLRATLGMGGAHSGFLMRITRRGAAKPVADVAAFEAASNPAAGPVDSNPYGLLCQGRAQIVTDAGGNDLFRVVKRKVSLLAVFPSRPARSTDSVPTSVALGRDHAYYIGELSGRPFAVGAASIYRVVPGKPPEIYLTGFTTIIDLAFDRRGNLYVLEYATGGALSGTGALIKVSRSGTRTTISSDLTQPTALLVRRNGTIYVANNGSTAGSGELLRLVR